MNNNLLLFDSSANFLIRYDKWKYFVMHKIYVVVTWSTTPIPVVEKVTRPNLFEKFSCRVSEDNSFTHIYI